jgi:DNA-3-methyladenine glycosylase I
MRAYHDTEWGVPERDGRALWGKLMLDGFQAGLSWLTILRKREAFRKAFRDFDPDVVARFGPADVKRLLGDAGIIRSRAKIESTIGGARAYLEMTRAGEDFSELCWSAVGGKPLTPARRSLHDIPAKTLHSEQLSKELKKRGFKFVGPVIVYAFMQATGMVNDHVLGCFRRETVSRSRSRRR